MRLFSLRTAEHYDRASWPVRARVGHVDPYMLPAYRWMARQLRARVGPPPRGAEGPIWAWVARPDLRSSFLMPRGTRTVMVELELDARAVLVSDYDRFHAVLNRTYLERDARDADSFNARAKRAGRTEWPFTPALRREVEASWERIFSFRRRDVDPRVHVAPAQALRQAVLWELRREQVVRETRFTAR